MDHSLYMTAGIACVAIAVIVLIVLGIGGNLSFGTGDLAGQATKGVGAGQTGDVQDAMSITQAELLLALDELKEEIMAEHDSDAQYLDNKIDGVESDLDGKIDGVSDEIDDLKSTVISSVSVGTVKMSDGENCADACGSEKNCIIYIDSSAGEAYGCYKEKDDDYDSCVCITTG